MQAKNWWENRSVYFFCRLLLWTKALFPKIHLFKSRFSLNQEIGLLYRTKHSLVYNLIVYYHYHTVHSKETVTGGEILRSHVACLLTYKFPCVTASDHPRPSSATWDIRESGYGQSEYPGLWRPAGNYWNVRRNGWRHTGNPDRKPRDDSYWS